MLRYALGAGELAVVTLALAYGAVQVRRMLLPGWAGAPARLAEAVLGVGALLLIAQLLGSVGQFREIPVLLGCVAVGVGGGRLAARRAPASTAESPCPPVHPLAVAIALGAAFLVVVHWGTFTGFSLDHGMYQSDSTWHNGPFATVFWQTGSTTALYQTDPLTFMPWFYPQNSELINAVGLLFLHNDFLTLFANHAWLLLALLAAWCIGRPWGVGPAALVGVLLILDANNMLTSQPGEAKTDLIGITFLIAAVAVLVNAVAAHGGPPAGGAGKNGARGMPIPQGAVFSGDRTRGPGDSLFGTTPWNGALVVAGLASGLALGSKYTLIPLVGVLLVGLIFIAMKGERVRTCLSFGLPMILTGGYWYLRNTIVSGTPLPQRSLDIGPLHLGAPQLPIDAYPQFSIAHYATDTDVWGTYFGPGLHETFGQLWWLAIGLAALGGLLALVAGRSRVIRVAGAAVVIGGLFYLVTPTSAGGEEGMPKAFVWNVRYLVPALALGMALLPIAPQLARTAGRRWGLLALVAALLLMNDAPLRAFQSDFIGEALVIGAILLLAPLALFLLRSRGAPLAPIAIGGLAVFVLAAGLGRSAQTDYLRDRYTDTYPQSVHNRGLAAAMEWAKGVHNSRIGIVGGTASNREYAFFNGDLSNEVQYIGVPGMRGAFLPAQDCKTWRERVNAGAYDYLVISPRYVPGTRYLPPSGIEAEWTRGPGARTLRDVRPVTVFELSGPLDPARCGRAARGAG